MSVLGLGGCLGAPGTEQSTPIPEELQRRVSLADQDTLGDEHGIRIEAEIVEPEVTDSQTARVRVTTTNAGRQRRLSYTTGGFRCTLFDQPSQLSEPRGLWLAQSKNLPETRDGDSRWLKTGLTNGWDGYGCSHPVYDPGASGTTEYGLLHDAREGGYMNPGTYRFEAPFAVFPAAGDHRPDEPSARLSWGFELEITDPRGGLFQ